jgi:hypothetical protein
VGCCEVVGPASDDTVVVDGIRYVGAVDALAELARVLH